MKRITILIFFISLFQMLVWAETPVWNLDRCLHRAMEYNLGLQQTKNKEKISQIELSQSKWALAPTVNARSNGNVNFRRATNQNNQITAGQTYNLSYGLNASMNLVDVFADVIRVSAMRFSVLACKESNLQVENNLLIDVISAYSACLFKKELMLMAEERVQLAMREKEKMATLIELGLLPQSSLNEMQALLSAKNLISIKAKNTYKAELLRFAQLLELPDNEGFELDENEFKLTLPVESKQNVDAIYAYASAHFPTIKEKEYKLNYYRKMVAVKKLNYLPDLHLSGAYGSGFYSTDILPGGQTTDFSSQYQKYLNPSVGLTLGIPILNGRAQFFQHKKAKVEMEDAIVGLEMEKNQIRKEIEEALQRLNANYVEYQFASDKLSLTQKTYNEYSEKFALGLLSAIEFNIAEAQLAEAKTDVLTAKYNWIIQDYSLKMYMGELSHELLIEKI